VTRKWWGIWIAAIVVTNALALLAYAQEKAPPQADRAAGAPPHAGRKASAPAPAALAPVPTAGAAASKAATADEEVEEVEAVEEVTPVAAVATTGNRSTLGKLVNLIGRFHPLLIHFPIAWAVLLLLVDLATFLLRRPWNTLGLLLGIGIAISIIPVVTTGLLRMATMGASGELLDLVQDHRNLALTASSIMLVAVVLRVVRRNELVGWARSAYLGLMALATLLIGLTGHYGGMVVHGKDFLSFGG